MSDLYSYIDRKFLFPFAEKVNGSAILNEYEKLIKSDWLSNKRLMEIQNNKLQNLVLHCYKNVPYYTELFNTLSINPSTIKSKEDLVRIPILTKQEIRNNYDKLISRDVNKRITKKHSTGGSTGVPLQYQADMDTWNVSWASTFRAWNWYGLNLGEKIFTIGGHSLVTKKKILTKKEFFEKWLMRNFKFSSSEMKPDDIKKYYLAYMNIKPSALRGYPSTLYVFAKYIEENKLHVHPVSLILTTGEVLLSNYRTKLQEVFRAPVYDNYGAGDGGISSHECYMHEGLHITEENCIIEICDQKGNVLENGQIGNVITTDLHNYVFPFLRYSVGDMSYIKRELCSCGRKSKLLGEVLGRSGRLLYSKAGIPISPTMLPVMLYPELDYHKFENQLLYNKIDRFQIQQDENGDISVLLKMKLKVDESTETFNYILENYRNAFLGSLIKISFVNIIEALPSGKEDYVISKFYKY